MSFKERPEIILCMLNGLKMKMENNPKKLRLDMTNVIEYQLIDDFIE